VVSRASRSSERAGVVARWRRTRRCRPRRAHWGRRGREQLLIRSRLLRWLAVSVASRSPSGPGPNGATGPPAPGRPGAGCRPAAHLQRRSMSSRASWPATGAAHAAGRHRAPHRLGGRHPLGQLLQEARRGSSGPRNMSRIFHELLEGGSSSRRGPCSSIVLSASIAARSGICSVRRAEGLRHALEVGVGDLLAELFHELLEALPGFGDTKSWCWSPCTLPARSEGSRSSDIRRSSPRRMTSAGARRRSPWPPAPDGRWRPALVDNLSRAFAVRSISALGLPCFSSSRAACASARSSRACP